MSQVLYFYSHSRVRRIPEEEKRRFRSIITYLTPDFNSNVPVEVRDYKITLPSELKDTAIPYIVRAHEGEHRLQDFALNPEDRLWRAIINRYRRRIFRSERVENEGDAMLAEWEIISILPDDLALETLKKLEEIPVSKNFPIQYKQQFSRIILNRHLSRDEYLAAEYEAGRYVPRGYVKKK
jgi:hypothetical protein